MGWLNKARSVIDANTPALDLKFGWGGSASSGGNSYSFAEGAWFFYNITDDTYLFGPVKLTGSSGTFEVDQTKKCASWLPLLRIFGAL